MALRRKTAPKRGQVSWNDRGLAERLEPRLKKQRGPKRPRVRRHLATLSDAASLMLRKLRGHGIGVRLEVYTSSDLEQKRAALKKLEAAVLRQPQPETRSEMMVQPNVRPGQ
jgi:hypothetical protein